MAIILLTGGTGLIGQTLQKQLENNNHKVRILTRSPKLDNHFKWDIKANYIDEKVFDNLDYIIHLAGAGIADKRWTDERKQVLINSRVESSGLLFSKIKELNIPLKGFISASGIGYYGAITSSKIYSEEDQPADDFIAKICIEWEAAANQFKTLNIPVTILRTGVVLSSNGGALKKMNTPLFLSALGTGKQYIPWIHIDDLCNLYVKAIEDDSFTGIYNAVAPEHKTNNDFTKTLAKVVKKPVLPINAPGFILKIVLGELAAIVLEGSRVSAEKTTASYNYKYENLEKALYAIYT
ncbi:hypothetical protein EV195_10566 [Tenacibaculum skagerrakense]|uniref:TIGR01777 family protein n=1 Tax=Tenacibaculum skagerrakense TaxID=186571 RepID=A0A4R2NTB6_9FLAO|nr:TIGR01777 family oxidoreductase [Tenacibaculum skagerrakense]TCP24635.1 hypothetical protein EV195_10566 [Tenacibaculum skagerrakense]